MCCELSVECLQKNAAFLEYIQKRGDRDIFQIGNVRHIETVAALRANKAGVDGWQVVQTDRPMIAVPLTMPAGVVRWAYGEQPKTNEQAQSYLSPVSFIPLIPGRNLIRYEASGSTALKVFLLDDTCELAKLIKARRYMRKPTAAPVTVTAAGVDVVSAIDLDSTGTVLQNQGTNDIYVTLDSKAADAAVATGASIKIPPGGSLELLDEMAWNGLINGIAPGGNTVLGVWRLYR